MTDRLKDKVAIVTGTGAVGPGWGNGKAISVLFAREGAKVIGVDICGELEHAPYPGATEEDLAETVRQVESAGGAMHAEQADVREYRDTRDALLRGVERFGG